MRIEDTLNGGYKGLYGEVVTCDMYHLRQVRFAPAIVFDIGANIGVFSRFARTLFPRALIVAVEPDPKNIAMFKHFTRDPNLVLLECAMGKGSIYHGLTAVNGSGETYLSPGLGYPEKELKTREDVVLSPVPAMLLQEIIRPYWSPGQAAILKLDCEGAENVLWDDQDAMNLMRQMSFLTFELHNFSLTEAELPEVVKATEAALASFEETHACEREHVYFRATKRS